MLNICSDTTPPRLNCPDDVTQHTDVNEDHATVSWLLPLAIDNSGYLPTLTSLPVLVPPASISIGDTTMTYIAKDSSGNKARCHFKITVLGKIILWKKCMLFGMYTQVPCFFADV